jgi:MFS family permease
MNPFLGAPASKKLITLIGICCGVVMCQIQSSGLSTLLPKAAEDVGNAELYPLASTLGGAVTVIVMPLYGWLGAKYPALKRMIIVIGFIVGAGVCLVRALAPNMFVIIAASLFWPIASASVYVISFSLIRDMYDRERAGVLLGLLATMLSVGMMVGAPLTGLLIDNFGWRIASHALWPFLLIAAALVFVGVKVSSEDAADMARDTGGFDLFGCIALALLLGGIILSLSLGASAGGQAMAPFGGMANNILIGCAVVGLAAFIGTVSKKGDQAILPVSALKNVNVVCLSLINVMTNASSMALFFFLPAYVMGVMKKSATEAALTVALMGVIGLVLGPIFGKWIAKARSGRGVATLGSIVRIGVTVLFLFLLAPTTSIWVVFALTFVAGVYNIQSMTLTSTAPQIQVPADLRVQGNSAIQMGQSVGAGVGMAIYTMIIAGNGVADGMPKALWVALGFAVVALVLGLFLRPLPDEAEGAAPKAAVAEQEAAS